MNLDLDLVNMLSDLKIIEYKYWSDNIAKKGLTVIY